MSITPARSPVAASALAFFGAILLYFLTYPIVEWGIIETSVIPRPLGRPAWFSSLLTGYVTPYTWLEERPLLNPLLTAYDQWWYKRVSWNAPTRRIY